MADFEGLQARYRELSPKIMELVRSGKRILVVTHIDADGLCSGSIAFASLMRRGANVSVRTIPDLDLQRVDELRAQSFDYYILTDLGASLVSELESSLE